MNIEPHIIFANADYAVFLKPSGMPSAPLYKDDTDNALYFAAKEYPAVLGVASKYKEIERGLVHRIDTATSGLILLAGNQESYNKLIEQQSNNDFVKFYTAIVTKTDVHLKEKKGFPPCPYTLSSLPLTICSSFRKYGPQGREVRPVLRDSLTYYARMKSVQADYSTDLMMMKPLQNDTVFHVRCRITKGFRHQVRCHLSWAGIPILGDEIYGFYNDLTSGNVPAQMFFFADGLEFLDPITNKKVTYSVEPDFTAIFLTSANK